MITRRAIFLTHKNSLYSEITGGVQLCSQEFLKIIKNIEGLNLEEYYVTYTKNILQRIRMKIGMENYSMYDVKKDKNALITYIKDHQINIVFINMASLVRYSASIKKAFGDNVKVILLSHGNHSGDFLRLITKPIMKQNQLRNFLNKLRLGLLISVESEYRIKYLDSVITLSETEKQIEYWFGAKRAVFLPRRLHAKFLHYKPVLGRVGFVGRLDHPPNFQGMQILLNTLKYNDHHSLEIRVVGAPEKYGKMLQNEFPFINYIGELSDITLEKEVATWALLLNPVWWYSTGASTKLGKAISWGIPIITTTAGMRGYLFKRGNLIIADTPEVMTKLILKESTNQERISYWANETTKAAESGPDDGKLVQLVISSLS